MGRTGCNLWFISDLWSKLIKKPGYEKVLAQGGDFGAGISTALALKHPENVLGLHPYWFTDSIHSSIRLYNENSRAPLHFSKNDYINTPVAIHHIRIKIRMNFTKLVPNIFYTDIKVGLRFFVECLEFTIGHDELNSDHPFCAIEKDGLSLLLFQNKEYAEKDRPEFRLVTNDIEEVYRKVASTYGK